MIATLPITANAASLRRYLQAQKNQLLNNPRAPGRMERLREAEAALDDLEAIEQHLRKEQKS